MICCDVASADFGEASFDCVIVNMALHHVLELEQLFANIRRWKRPQERDRQHDRDGLQQVVAQHSVAGTWRSTVRATVRVHHTVSS